MKTLLLSTLDVAGGGARAAYRLHKSLQKIGVLSQMLVQQKLSDDPSVLAPQNFWENAIAKGAHALEKFPLLPYQQRNKSYEFSTQLISNPIISKISKLNPDVVNLHWINDNFLNIEDINKISKPIVWTLHDMWPFTGGCHYNQNCTNFQNTCGACPQLGSTRDRDLSRWIWTRKKKSWHKSRITLVTLSRWMSEAVKSSALFGDFRIEQIPNSLDTTLYKPIDKLLARKILNIPIDKRVLLFGAVNATSSPRKGFYLLKPVLEQLAYSEWANQLELMVFGASQSSLDQELGLTIRYFGKLSDDISLSLIYSAADVFVAPSIQDNLPNTIMESLACGTPCVAFKIGGMPDLIDHCVNGYLAQPFEPEDFVKGICWILENSTYPQLAEQARKKVEREFTQELQAYRYKSLFQSVLKNTAI